MDNACKASNARPIVVTTTPIISRRSVLIRTGEPDGRGTSHSALHSGRHPSRRTASVHPALRRLGRSAPRFVANVRRRRRIELTRQGATVFLAAGVALCGPLLAMSGGPDAAASRGNASVHARATTHAPTGLRVVSALAVSEAFAAPRPSVTSVPDVSAFRGFDASLGTARHWVAYPASRLHPFLVCTRGFESDTAGGYRAVSRDGVHRGAYQFKRSTWNNVARHVGRANLIGLDPAQAAPVDQDWMALYLYKWLGAGHWEGRCAGR